MDISSTQLNPTSLSLIMRVKADDPMAWQQLTRLYGPLVYHWCRRAGLQSHDASNIVQEVFKSVTLHIGAFRRDAEGHTFRGWLWTITRNQIRYYYRTLQREPQAIGGSGAVRWMAEIPEVEPPDFDEPKAPDSMSALMCRCLQQMQNQFEPKTWQAFHSTAIDFKDTSQVAEDLGMSVAAVRKAKSRVLLRIREEFDALIDSEMPPSLTLKSLPGKETASPDSSVEGSGS